MPAFGGLSPYPRRCGGGTPRLQVILESLNTQMGDGYDTQQTSYVYARNMAIARMLNGAWATNARLGNQNDGKRMTTTLARWVKIRDIRLAADANDDTKRAAVVKRERQDGRSPTLDVIHDELVEALGPLFVALELIAPPVAVVHDDSGYFGSAVDGAPWYSTVAHILVRVVQPAGYSDAEFFDIASRTHKVLDPLVPAWVTYDWYTAPIVGTPIPVTDGPSASGFYLDEPNLSRVVFSDHT